MATDQKQKSVKGILKNSSSFDHDVQSSEDKRMKWDEMNILATYHPPDKEYGHMKIDDPPTPYHRDEGDSEEDLDPVNLALRLSSENKPRVSVSPRERSQSTSGDDEEAAEDVSPEEKDRRASFEQKRKMHYNEFQAIKLARKLLEEENDEDDDDDDNDDSAETKNTETNTTNKITAGDSGLT